MHAQFSAEWIDTSPINAYDERVAAHVIVDATDGRIAFRCKREFYDVAFQLWRDTYKTDSPAPRPDSPGHCMFVHPLDYGCVPEDCTGNRAMMRRARRNRLLGVLHGWDRELRKSIDGMRKLVRIVNATLDAQDRGEKTGGTPFVCCLMAGR